MQLSPEKVRAYILGGRALLTVQNKTPLKESESQFTFSIRLKKNVSNEHIQPVYYVYNNSDYIGYIINDVYTKSNSLKAVKLRERAMEVFDWCWKYAVWYPQFAAVKPQYIRPNIVFFHNGYCARCTRLLTDAVSLETGFGPECRKILGIPEPLKQPAQ